MSCATPFSCRMSCMRQKQHTTSCGSGNSLFTAGGAGDILLASLSGGPGLLFLFPRPLFIVLNVYAPPHILWSLTGTGPGQSADSGLIGPGQSGAAKMSSQLTGRLLSHKIPAPPFTGRVCLLSPGPRSRATKKEPGYPPGYRRAPGSGVMVAKKKPRPQR